MKNLFFVLIAFVTVISAFQAQAQRDRPSWDHPSMERNVPSYNPVKANRPNAAKVAKAFQYNPDALLAEYDRDTKVYSIGAEEYLVVRVCAFQNNLDYKTLVEATVAEDGLTEALQKLLGLDKDHAKAVKKLAKEEFKRITHD
jgi:hypothetical protein